MSPVRYASGRGRGVLLATVLGSGIAFLDGTAVNVALPTLGQKLGADLAGLQWTVDGYLLTLSALLLVGGSLGDHLGRRRVFSVGLVWFALASALCGLSPSIGFLVAARALQGVGAALLVPGSLALLESAFVPEDRSQAIGAWAGLSGVTTAVGPLLGGWLVQAATWRLIFFINLPLSALALWATFRFIDESSDPGARGRLDFLGAGLAVIGLAGLVFGLIEGPRLGWLSAPVLGACLLGCGALGAFLWAESRHPNPMLPLALFKSRAFSAANATTLAVYFALGGAIFLLVFQLQQVVGYSPLQAGASLTPVTFLMLTLSPSAGRIASRRGPRSLMAIGPAIAGGGLAWLANTSQRSTYWGGVLPGVLVLGLGLAATVAPLTSAALSSAPARYAGIASGVNNAIARIAGLLAVALLPLAGGIAETGATSGEAFSSGFRRAMWVSAVLCALGGAIAWLAIPPKQGPESDSGGSAR